MARESKGPWYWKARQQWVVNVNGKRHYLGPDERKARRKWCKLVAKKDEHLIIRTDSLLAVFDAFLDWTLNNREHGTYEWYCQRLNEFAPRVKSLRVEDLRPYHVQEWIDTKRSGGHKRGCVVAVQRALNWAVKQGRIERNPIALMEKPSAGRRELVLDLPQFNRLLTLASDKSFRDLLTFCWETGCRPQEAFALESRHVELSRERCIFQSPNRRESGKSACFTSPTELRKSLPV